MLINLFIHALAVTTTRSMALGVFRLDTQKIQHTVIFVDISILLIYRYIIFPDLIHCNWLKKELNKILLTLYDFHSHQLPSSHLLGKWWTWFWNSWCCCLINLPRDEVSELSYDTICNSLDPKGWRCFNYTTKEIFAVDLFTHLPS